MARFNVQGVLAVTYFILNNFQSNVATITLEFRSYLCFLYPNTLANRKPGIFEKGGTETTRLISVKE